MARFHAKISLSATDAATAANDLIAMSRAHTNKSVLVEYVEGWEVGSQ